MTRNPILIAVFLLGAGLAFHAGADVSPRQLAQNDAAASAQWTAGEVRKLDKAAGTVTIKHGPVPKLEMPPMIMAYHVKDKSMLDDLKPGDMISFDVDRIDGKYTVTGLKKVK